MSMKARDASAAAMPEDEASPDEIAWAVDRALELARRLDVGEGVEVRADLRDDRRYVLRDGKLTAARVTLSSGLGAQVHAGGGSAYAYTAELAAPAIAAALAHARELAIANGARQWARHAPRLAPRKARYEPDAKDPPHLLADPTRAVDLLSRVERGMHEIAPDTRAQLGFGALTTRTIMADTLGSHADRTSLLSTLMANVNLHRDGKMGVGLIHRGGERGLGDYEDHGGPEELGREGARRCVDSLRAEHLPAGRYRVLCDPLLSGTLAHESFGHLTEYDLVSSGWSKLQGRRGETLAQPSVSIVDAPTVPGKQGIHLPFDDQILVPKPVTLLDQGVLRAWMHTRDSASESDDEPMGNGRALNSRFAPMVRMRNTYFEPGDASVEEAIRALGDGVYLLGATGGAPASDGSFMFTAVRGFKVERGEIGAPIRHVAIHGNVLDFLRNVELLARDFEVATNYFGGCGKKDQSFLHVGMGGPHVLVRDALVGGSAA